MMWYSVSLLFKSRHPDDTSLEVLWEEIIILVLADSEEQAVERAKELGKRQETTFDTPEGGGVNWTLEDVLGVCDIEKSDFAVGLELFSRFLDNGQAAAMRRMASLD